MSALSLRTAGEAISLTENVSRAIGPLNSREWGNFPKEVKKGGDDEGRVTHGNLERNQLNKG